MLLLMEVIEHSFGSEALERALYVPARCLLFIAFRSGRIYRYEGVSEATFRDLLAAPSAGAFFNETLRHYPYSEVRDLSQAY
ncbi:KTSC domain-containing protein [Afifella marina]|uniref:KTSC domain-containing protein n=1 Tax=Afifella marina DSM 2698 TaxID=1120955 RepID=A0A1G5N3B1_AFIMA|nr:KTSC domain-containing protein [Afifella marina]MBK1622389.1 KTSC domain-containing protein [Afifella marina DSM 2698]MBK1626897.1 KTSC domain-containing protein [Afifella marina]MBK5919173.1 hypothetical protein [Afifella marina]RAI21221.1 hypothetical protein CH311_06995 [Afifella marina DSM 2698]SCZ31832.1 KTSC domain-containing protein [Afifella marina DSM 2698]